MQQVNNGNVSSSEVDKSFSVDSGQVLGDPDGGRQSRALIRKLEEKVQEHLFLVAFISFEPTSWHMRSQSCTLGGYLTQSSRGMSWMKTKQEEARSFRGGSLNRPQSTPDSRERVEAIRPGFERIFASFFPQLRNKMLTTRISRLLHVHELGRLAHAPDMIAVMSETVEVWTLSTSVRERYK